MATKTPKIPKVTKPKIQNFNAGNKINYYKNTASISNIGNIKKKKFI